MRASGPENLFSSALRIVLYSVMNPTKIGPALSVLDLGCCGAFCGTCPEMSKRLCQGCKTGYGDGSRILSRARCRIKVCCLGKGTVSCADCADFLNCETLRGFHSKNGYKYRKYREALEFIREHGYESFLENAVRWRSQYGALEQAPLPEVQSCGD